MIFVVIPTRGRPDRAGDVLAAIQRTARKASTTVVFAVDRDDPEFPRYEAVAGRPDRKRFGWEVDRPWLIGLDPSSTGNLVRATNAVSMRIARRHPESVIANWGDDHVPRTIGWDVMVDEILRDGPGIAYGDDLIHGAHLPSAPFISAPIVNALGWYALPTQRHLYIDDCWRDLGQALGRLHYMPDVVIEHMHPAVSKADWDEGYRKVFDEQFTEQEREAYLTWRESGGLGAATSLVRTALASSSSYPDDPTGETATPSGRGAELAGS